MLENQKFRWVPVVSSTGQPLDPCHPARARKLMAKGKAVARYKHGFFYIKLTQRATGVTHLTVVGVDPGSKMEGFTVKSQFHTLVNIQAVAVNGKVIKKAMEFRKVMRRARRQRTTPYRKCRFNRSHPKDWVPPSTKARWQHKYNIIQTLRSLYPISVVAIEDVSSITKKGAKHWNTSFSPVQAGKNWLYSKLKLLGLEVVLFKGMDTFKLREYHCLTKSKAKLSYCFSSHCVDSWVLANAITKGHLAPELTTVLRLSRLPIPRRMLHRANPSKGGTRTRYGGSMSLGYKKGTLVDHPKHGRCFTGGYQGDRLTLHSPVTTERIVRNAKPSDLRPISYSPWRLTDPDTFNKANKTVLRQQRLVHKLTQLGAHDSRIAYQLRYPRTA